MLSFWFCFSTILFSGEAHGLVRGGPMVFTSVTLMISSSLTLLVLSRPAVTSVVAPARASGNHLLTMWPFPQQFGPATLLLWQATSTDPRCRVSSGGLFVTGRLRVPVVVMPSWRGSDHSLVCVMGIRKWCASPGCYSHFLSGSLSLNSNSLKEIIAFVIFSSFFLATSGT